MRKGDHESLKLQLFLTERFGTPEPFEPQEGLFPGAVWGYLKTSLPAGWTYGHDALSQTLQLSTPSQSAFILQRVAPISDSLEWWVDDKLEDMFCDDVQGLAKSRKGFVQGEEGAASGWFAYEEGGQALARFTIRVTAGVYIGGEGLASSLHILQAELQAFLRGVTVHKEAIREFSPVEDSADPAGFLQLMPSLRNQENDQQLTGAIADADGPRLRRLLLRRKGTLVEDVLRWVRDRRVFAKVQQEAPPIFGSANFLGTVPFLGRKFNDGTHLLTVWVSFVIPLWPLGQYIVLHDGGRYQFLGKLSPAKGVWTARIVVTLVTISLYVLGNLQAAAT